MSNFLYIFRGGGIQQSPGLDVRDRIPEPRQIEGEPAMMAFDANNPSFVPSYPRLNFADNI